MTLTPGKQSVDLTFYCRYYSHTSKISLTVTKDTTVGDIIEKAKQELFYFGLGCQSWNGFQGADVEFNVLIGKKIASKQDNLVQTIFSKDVDLGNLKIEACPETDTKSCPSFRKRVDNEDRNVNRKTSTDNGSDEEVVSCSSCVFGFCVSKPLIIKLKDTSRVGGVTNVEAVDLNSLENGKIHRLWVDVTPDAMGFRKRIPVLVCKGSFPGPVLGINAVLHGNEINGVPVIQRLAREIDVTKLHGSLVAIVVANVHGFSEQTRTYQDHVDLNRVMPGDSRGRGNCYAKKFHEQFLNIGMDYFLDLHTASFGRKNSLYCRADMTNVKTAKMALLQHTQFILNTKTTFDGRSTTLRNAAEKLGISAITLEIGDPSCFNKKFIREALPGIFNLMESLNMIEPSFATPNVIKIDPKTEKEDKSTDDGNLAKLSSKLSGTTLVCLPQESVNPAVMCSHSIWVWTDSGGILNVQVEIGAFVVKDQILAELSDIFGCLITRYLAPTSGWVIGMCSNPVVHTGDRICHIGIENDMGLDVEGILEEDLE